MTLNKLTSKGIVPIHTAPATAGMLVSQHIPSHLNYPCFLYFLFKNHHSRVVTPLHGNEDCKRENGRQAVPIQHFPCTCTMYHPLPHTHHLTDVPIHLHQHSDGSISQEKNPMKPRDSKKSEEELSALKIEL